MTELNWSLLLALAVLAWVGHACIWTALLSNLYGRPLPRGFLKAWRALSGLLIVGFPLLIGFAVVRDGWEPINGLWSRFVLAYAAICLVFGVLILPTITLQRHLRRPPSCTVTESTWTLDLWPELGEKLVGDGKFTFMARLPGNCLFRVDFTDLTLAVPDLPPEWDGLSILAVSDLHFHGTPSRVFFERVFEELSASPPPDLVCLIGDYVDSDAHRDWIRPLLGRLSATEGRFAILGNHDQYHDPDRVRAELDAAGYTVLGNSWREVTIRGVRCLVVGHEGPWFAPQPDLSAAPDLFRLCLSHTPDNFYWGIANRVGLMLCGHVHGGAIRVPVIGSIFVPSIYGRRFDMGVFEQGGTIMVINRGLSGKEPIRFRCNPQLMRIKLVGQKLG